MRTSFLFFYILYFFLDDRINPLIAGNKIFGIFGFCDIRNFTDMTEILQERVMLFVNDIA